MKTALRRCERNGMFASVCSGILKATGSTIFYEDGNPGHYGVLAMVAIDSINRKELARFLAFKIHHGKEVWLRIFKGKSSDPGQWKIYRFNGAGDCIFEPADWPLSKALSRREKEPLKGAKGEG